MSYVRKMIERDKNARITVGCRCAFKKDSDWAKSWFEPGRHCIIEKRDGSDFAVFVLSKGFTGPLKRDILLYDNDVAWVPENDLELVDRNYPVNLDFLDWYQEIKEDICGDCCEAFYDHKRNRCPNPNCPGNAAYIGDGYRDEEV